MREDARDKTVEMLLRSLRARDSLKEAYLQAAMWFALAAGKEKQ